MKRKESCNLRRGRVLLQYACVCCFSCFSCFMCMPYGFAACACYSRMCMLLLCCRMCLLLPHVLAAAARCCCCPMRSLLPHPLAAAWLHVLAAACACRMCLPHVLAACACCYMLSQLHVLANDVECTSVSYDISSRLKSLSLILSATAV